MKNEKDMIKWLNNLKSDIGQPQHSQLWHYAEILDVIAKYLASTTEEVVDFNNMISGSGRIRNLPPVNQKQITGKLENAENATSEGEESTMSQPKSKLDCISRQQAVEALMAHFIPQTYTGEQVEQAEKLAQKIMNKVPPVEDMGEVSDGYHTFNQLYHQRAVLFATIVNQNKDKAWKSWKHEDGQFCFDKGGEWFIVGVDTPKGSYTYHYEKKYWDMFDCEELDRGKHWDGHTEEDVTRLLSLPPVTPTVSEDCISRQAAIKYINDYAHMFTTGNYFEGMMNAVDLLKRLDLFPPVTPTERTGEWTNTGVLTVHCSNCKSEFHELEAMNYCPNCGAKMGGDTE